MPPEVSDAGLSQGDRIELVRTPATDEQPAQFNFFGIARDLPLAHWWFSFQRDEEPW